MAIPFLNNINLSDNQLLNAKLQVTGSAPTAAAGQIYFNSTDSVARYHNGTAWVDIPRQISVGGTGLADSQAIDLVAGANVGIAESSGTYVTVMMADKSDDINDLINYNKLMNENNYDAIMGSRFLKESKVTDYPTKKMILNRLNIKFLEKE